MFTQHLALVVLVISVQRGFLVNGISCYECRSISASGHCISDNGVATECEKKYCTIYRQEYLDPAGKIKKMYRSCENAPSYLNAVIRTTNNVAYYRACDSDLCNSGNGVEEFTVIVRNSSSSTIYLVPGVGSAADTVFCHDKLIVTLVNLLALSLYWPIIR